MRIGLTALVALAAALGSIGAGAQTPPVRFSAEPPDDAVADLMAQARADLPRIADRDGRPFPVAAPGDQGGAVIPPGEARAIIDAGFASGVARWCQLDWQQNLRLLMNEQRQRGTWSDRQLAFIGVLHAHAMSAVMDANRNRSCSTSDRLIVGDYLRRRWP